MIRGEERRNGEKESRGKKWKQGGGNRRKVDCTMAVRGKRVNGSTLLCLRCIRKDVDPASIFFLHLDHAPLTLRPLVSRRFTSCHSSHHRERSVFIHILDGDNDLPLMMNVEYNRTMLPLLYLRGMQQAGWKPLQPRTTCLRSFSSEFA